MLHLPGKLLRRLDLPLRHGRGQPLPSHHPDGTPAPRGTDDDVFSRWLNLVADGRTASDRPVRVDDHARLKSPLDETQLGRLGAAADRARAAGAKHALMLLDGRGIRMNIEDRVVSGELGVSSSGEVKPDTRTRADIVGIDTAVFVHDGNDDGSGAAPGPPSVGVVPGTITKFFPDSWQQNATTSANDSNGDVQSPPAEI